MVEEAKHVLDDAKHVAEDTKHALEEAAHSEQVQQMAAKTSELLEQAKVTKEHFVDQVKHTTDDFAHQAMEATEHLVEQVKTSTDQLKTTTEHFVAQTMSSVDDVSINIWDVHTLSSNLVLASALSFFPVSSFLRFISIPAHSVTRLSPSSVGLLLFHFPF